MAHFALFCPPFFSHIRVFEAVAAALALRGHRSTLIINAGGSALVADPNLSVEEVGVAEGRTAIDVGLVIRRAARPNGPLGVLQTVADTASLTDALCADAPRIVRTLGADAVIGDQMEAAAGLVAAHLALPHVSIAGALPINPAPGAPLPFLGWSFDPSDAGLKRNAGGERVARLLLTRQRHMIERWSERFGLARRSTLEDCLSPVLQVAQTVPGFDFPRPPDERYHAVGPIRPAGASAQPLSLPLDPGKPLVFASLGTLQGHRLGIFKTIAKACRAMDVQLLVAHCGGLDERRARSIGATFVTDFAPQAAVLAKASICVTHGGLNTVLDALQAGVPLLAIPIAFDQQGVAARIVHHRVGRRLSRRLLQASSVRQALEDLLADEGYRLRAAAIGREIAVSGGADAAADLIDALVRAGTPTL